MAKTTLYLVYVLCLLLGGQRIGLANERITIPAGTFLMSCSKNDPVCDKDEGPAGGTSVMVTEFNIDKYEVSVNEYRTCLEAGKCSRPKDHARNKYCNFDAKGREQHPVNCLDWDQAQSFCQWQGGRLPFEAEWEKAARAGSTSRYPWGQEVSCQHAILDDGKTMGSVANEPDGCGEDRTWPRGSRSANQFGLYDMHGNAGEWIHNWYAADAITQLYAKGNLKGPDSGKRKLVRGGSWDENRDNLRSSFRNVKEPVSGDGVYGSIGFRCVYHPK